jgi:F-type H+-transporting ATPase subunit delta
MATRDEQDRGAAAIYAAALLALAEEAGRADEVLTELAELARLVTEDAEFAAFLSSPLIEAEERRKVLENTLRGRASDLVVDALQVLNRRGRAGLIPELAAAYRDCLRAKRGEVDAKVLSAVALTAGTRDQLTQALARYSGKHPELIERVDPAVLGGLVVEIEGKQIDTSIATRLRAFAAALVERASREIGAAVASE